MRRVEVPNNTPEQVVEYLTQALVLLEEVAPPDELREAAFVSIVNLLSGKQIIMEQPQAMDLSRLGLNGPGPRL